MKCRYLISVLMFFFLISPEFIKAQDKFPVSVKDGSITYEEVVSVSSNLTKNDLYLKTKQWAGQYFMVSPNYNPIQFDNMENGCIIVQIRLKRIYPDRTSTTGPWDVTCFGKIQVKNSKYKYTFSNFQYNNEDISEYNRQIKMDGFDWMVNPVNKLQKYERAILELIDIQMWKIISSLKVTLNEPVIDSF